MVESYDSRRFPLFHLKIRADLTQFTSTLIRYMCSSCATYTAHGILSSKIHFQAYKPARGKLSEDEYAILDEINGLVLAGEIALERLQRAMLKFPKNSSTAAFSDRED